MKIIIVADGETPDNVLKRMGLMPDAVRVVRVVSALFFAVLGCAALMFHPG